MKSSFKNNIILSLKGIAMGVANVIPGVSGGTIALITGIFERLINAIKSFNLQALKYIFKAQFRSFAKHVDLNFLFFVFLGVGIAIISIAKLFEYLFEYYPVYIWAFFFGLVLASVYFVAKQINKWSLSSIVSFVFGTIAAIGISILTPASENEALWYVLICGAIAACSMILPGLSGSFVLILMGNYQLIMIDAINKFRLEILIPTIIGAGAGILGFSYLLSWVFKKFRDQTIGLLSGFILGSLGILWPWKETIVESFGDKTKVVAYKWFMPEMNSELFIAIAIILAGMASIWAMEYFASKKQNDE
ncbi:MAG: DUF368 domain-containing protein [Bacteroidales bacterium]|nr:DUF368 domain-containing protein [Bacteroidales bacterium]MDD4236607.1 DUF368 domain-containing protein [Bacteroidales bacterium]